LARSLSQPNHSAEGILGCFWKHFRSFNSITYSTHLYVEINAGIARTVSKIGALGGLSRFCDRDHFAGNPRLACEKDSIGRGMLRSAALPDGAPVVCWESAPVTVTADEAMAPERKRRGPRADARDEAATWLRAALHDGPRMSLDVMEEAVEGEGIAKRTLDRARKAIGVVAFRPDNPGPWWWRLPGEAGCHKWAICSPSRNNVAIWQSAHFLE
jgi:hypothetical protein